MQHAHFMHTPNMYAACNPHTHFKHALSMPYDGHTHTTSTMNVRCIHAPQCRGCEHAACILCGCVGVACMHAVSDMPICMVCNHPAYIHAEKGRVLCQSLICCKIVQPYRMQNYFNLHFTEGKNLVNST
jgi:hypothetical protein